MKGECAKDDWICVDSGSGGSGGGFGIARGCWIIGVEGLCGRDGGS